MFDDSVVGNRAVVFRTLARRHLRALWDGLSCMRLFGLCDRHLQGLAGMGSLFQGKLGNFLLFLVLSLRLLVFCSIICS